MLLLKANTTVSTKPLIYPALYWANQAAQPFGSEIYTASDGSLGRNGLSTQT